MKIAFPKIVFAGGVEIDEEEYITLQAKYNVGQKVRIPKARKFNIEIHEDIEHRAKHRFEDGTIIGRWEQIVEGTLYQIQTQQEIRWVGEKEIRYVPN